MTRTISRSTSVRTTDSIQLCLLCPAPSHIAHGPRQTRVDAGTETQHLAKYFFNSAQAHHTARGPHRLAAHTATKIVSTVAEDTMNHFLRITSCTLTALGCVQGVAAQTAATVLFAQPGTHIVGESTVARAAVKGDVLQTGELLVTPAGSISQVVLPDGSLIGMRPESEPQITPAPAGSGSKAPVVGLTNGTVRVISAELMDSKKISNFTLQSGAPTISLKGADLESAVLRSDAKPAIGADAGAAPGSYQRLLVGSANAANGNQVTAFYRQDLHPVVARVD